ncbi:MAG: molybdopterin-dependent oxidoreductase [Euryarchaeota archaeon]|nr:molybdopterin-dependent oxidoreductase [Euryarchaeota archaeon]
MMAQAKGEGKIYMAPRRAVRRPIQAAPPAFAGHFSVIDLEREDFVISLFPLPEPLAPEALEVVVCGLDCKPRRLRMADLEAMGRASQGEPGTRGIVRTHVPLICQIFNCVIEGVTWEGFRLRDVLARTGLDAAGANHFAFYSRDGHYFEALTRAEALDPRVLLATGMNGGPLPHEHGGPIRLVVPFLQGYKSIKWLCGIRAFPHSPLGIKTLLGQSKDGSLARAWQERYGLVPPEDPGR